MIEIGIKNVEVFESLMEGLYHYKLCEIAKDLINLMSKMSLTPTITSAYRNGDTGVHGYGRGLDFRTHHLSIDEINTLCSVINERWCYDPARPEMVCLMYHDVGKGPHLHLQVHPNTKERKYLYETA